MLKEEKTTVEEEDSEPRKEKQVINQVFKVDLKTKPKQQKTNSTGDIWQPDYSSLAKV